MKDQQLFEGHAFNDQLPKGRTRGELIVENTHFLFVMGDQKIKIPFAGAELSLGGASDRLVFINHPALADWSFYTSDRSILNQPHLQAQANLLANVQQTQKKLRRKNIVIFALVAVIILTPAVIIFKMDWVTKYAARQVAVAWEEKIGESSLSQFKAGQDFMPKQQSDPLLEPLLRPLESLAINDKYNYRFSILNEASTNAFALPGGYIVIHSGLILEAESAEELLGVIAHEMAHVNQQHGIRNVIGSAGIYLIASILIGDANGVIATLAAMAPFLINQSYSRKFEKEADLLGHQALVEARIHPRGLASFFEKLKAQEEKMLEQLGDSKQLETLQDALGFLSTHPASEDRIEYLRSLPVDANVRYLDLTNEFESLKLAVQDFVANSSPSSPPGEPVQ